ncbi:MAG: hypothetical protein EWV89_05040 [Microcystis wesenbergii Mw_QC_B_20070930_S4]|nr:MAG: hypothetical protein EWV89_05040 [Microcystis wesenbergii Mw_QC_B_20070930_S4]
MWGVGCGVWGFNHFEVVNYLFFREKVPCYPTRFLDLFSKPYLDYSSSFTGSGGLIGMNTETGEIETTFTIDLPHLN